MANLKLRVVLDLEGRDVYWQMAIDEAMLMAKLRGIAESTLRIYKFKPSAVTVGYFQKIEEAVNLGFLNEMGIQYTRRITGGGSVFHDSDGEITYSIVLPATGDLANVQESYRIICNGIVYALRKLGVRAEFVPVNDVVVHGRKISGSAQARRGGYLLQHGTLMYATNLDVLEKVLVAPVEKLRNKGVKSIKERVVTLKQLTGAVNVDELVKGLIEGFAISIGAEPVPGELTGAELKLAEELVSKYRSREWIFKR
ncbi:MAG: biotin/lipoate A/B protein ligase family protein [Desulfurococcaceae archaeon]